MRLAQSGEADALLSAWRTRVVNIFSIVAALVASLMLATLIIKAAARPGIWPSVVIAGLLTMLFVVMAIFRQVKTRICAWLVLLSAFAAGVLDLANYGLGGDGRLLLFTLLIVGLVLINIRASSIMHRQGLLWEAVRASMSLPGIYPPVLYHGDLLVDGGVMNNLPVDIMRQLVQGGCIMAVNVSPPEDLVKAYNFGPAISGVRALLSRLNRRDSISVPLISDCLTRIMVLHDVNGREAKQQLADIYLAPPVYQFGLLEFGAYDPIIEIGYRTAREELEREKAK